MHVRHFPSSSEDRAVIASAIADESFRQAYHEDKTLASMRAGALAVAGSRSVRQPLPDVRVTPQEVAGVPCERLSPPRSDRPGLVVYIHGGGFVRGSLALQRANASFIARAAGMEVLAIGYRQAPEHPYPAAPSDVAAVYAALLDEGLAPSSIAVVGESSGGCLALGLAVSLQDARERLPAGIAAVSPMVDLSLQGASWHYNAGKDVADLDAGRRLVALYLGGADPAQPLASPVLFDFGQGCPLLIGVGSHETMLSDAEYLARKASDAGATVELQIHEAMPHGFTRFTADASDRALAAVAAWCVARVGEAGRAV